MPSPSRLTIMLGTAGHIDHGKTALVHFLTGCNTDRLPEEQRRGMSIDLGFAPCLLEGDRRVGIVDVPGHERFIRNMVAGVTGIDAVLLVVAADDGIMPQTREHFEVVDLLGVRHGLVAITKIDKAPELVPLVIQEVREFVAGTFLEGAPILPVSSVTGEGIGELRQELARLVAGITPRPSEGLFRMPIENVFTVKGFGTVITGIPVGGCVRLGDTLEVLPGELSGRVRGIQVYQDATEEGRAGECVAINLADVPHQAVTRGQVAVAAGHLRPTRFCEGRLRHLASAGAPLRSNSAVKFHTGTSETAARLVLLDQRALAPGEEGLVQVVLEQPVLVAPGDAYVVRSLSPTRTIGGGRVISLSERRRRPLRPWVLEELSEAEQALDDGTQRVELALRLALTATAGELAGATGLTPDEVEQALATLCQAGRAQHLARPDCYLHVDTRQRIAGQVAAALADFHAGHPLRPGMERAALARAVELPPHVLEAALAALAEAGQVRTQGPYVAQAGWQPQLSPQDQALLGQIESKYEQAGLSVSPVERELASLAEAPRLEALRRLLLDQGVLVRTADGTTFHRAALAAAERMVREHLGGQGEISAAAFRDLAQTNRQVAITVLEHLDRVGVTVRVGDVRRLRS